MAKHNIVILSLVKREKRNENHRITFYFSIAIICNKNMAIPKITN